MGVEIRVVLLMYHRLQRTIMDHVGDYQCIAHARTASLYSNKMDIAIWFRVKGEIGNIMQRQATEFGNMADWFTGVSIDPTGKKVTFKHWPNMWLLGYWALNSVFSNRFSLKLEGSRYFLKNTSKRRETTQQEAKRPKSVLFRRFQDPNVSPCAGNHNNPGGLWILKWSLIHCQRGPSANLTLLDTT